MSYKTKKDDINAKVSSEEVSNNLLKKRQSMFIPDTSRRTSRLLPDTNQNGHASQVYFTEATGGNGLRVGPERDRVDDLEEVRVDFGGLDLADE